MFPVPGKRIHILHHHTPSQSSCNPSEIGACLGRPAADACQSLSPDDPDEYRAMRDTYAAHARYAVSAPKSDNYTVNLCQHTSNRLRIQKLLHIRQSVVRIKIRLHVFHRDERDCMCQATYPRSIGARPEDLPDANHVI